MILSGYQKILESANEAITLEKVSKKSTSADGVSVGPKTDIFKSWIAALQYDRLLMNSSYHINL